MGAGMIGEHQSQQIGAETTSQKGTHQCTGAEDNAHVDLSESGKHIVIRELASSLPKGQSLAP